ncbi:hypothetical protein BREVUG8_110195 [Brevundimonas sp. G8]|nr:hypothetical protein BREVUG8_110195 [Brevundimonas sp. G8]
MRSALEERQDDLRRLVGDRQGLDAKLLLNLQGLKARAFLGQVGVHQIADAGLQRVRQFADIGGVALDLLGLGAQFGQTRRAGGDGGVDPRQGVIRLGLGQQVRRRRRRAQAQPRQRQVLTVQGDGFGAVGAGQEVDARRCRAVQDVRSVEDRIVRERLDRLQQRLELVVVGGPHRQGGALVGSGCGLALQLDQQVRDLFARRQRNVRDRSGAVQAGGDSLQRTTIRTLSLGDRPDGGVVSGALNLQSRVHPALRRRQLVVGAVQILQGDHRRGVGVDAGGHGFKPPNVLLGTGLTMSRNHMVNGVETMIAPSGEPAALDNRGDDRFQTAVSTNLPPRYVGSLCSFSTSSRGS